MFQRATSALAIVAICGSLGCASSFFDPSGRLNSLENAQREYTKLIRWGEIRRAAVYVEPDYREDFLGYVETFEQIRITDADYDPLGLDPSDGRAEVEVVYHAYSLATLQEKRIVEVQAWTRHDGMKNNWLVRPEIASIVEAFHANAAGN